MFLNRYVSWLIVSGASSELVNDITDLSWKVKEAKATMVLDEAGYNVNVMITWFRHDLTRLPPRERPSLPWSSLSTAGSTVEWHMFEGL